MKMKNLETPIQKVLVVQKIIKILIAIMMKKKFITPKEKQKKIVQKKKILKQKIQFLK
jgi:hypothetical protein